MLERLRRGVIGVIGGVASRLGLVNGRCPVCAALTATDAVPNGTTGTDGLCRACAAALTPRSGGCCHRCGRMFGNAASQDGHTPAPDTPQKGAPPVITCGECRLNPPPWDRFYFHGPYTDALRHLVLDYKFNGGLHRTRLLSSMAVAAFRHGRGRVPDLVVPVPLHPRRLVWRGYNQSTELARALGRALPAPVNDRALVRTRNTVPQTRLDMRQRRENIRDAFSADPELVSGRAVLLVDDVFTTGATMTECARTLCRAGAKTVDVLVLARACGDSA
jgi:ComF family protein